MKSFFQIDMKQISDFAEFGNVFINLTIELNKEKNLFKYIYSLFKQKWEAMELMFKLEKYIGKDWIFSEEVVFHTLNPHDMKSLFKKLYNEELTETGIPKNGRYFKAIKYLVQSIICGFVDIKEHYKVMSNTFRKHVMQVIDKDGRDEKEHFESLISIATFINTNKYGREP